MAAKKRVSIVPDPPSMDVSQNNYAMSMAIREEHLAYQHGGVTAADQPKGGVIFLFHIFYSIRCELLTFSSLLFFDSFWTSSSL